MNALSEDAKAIVLLCGRLGKSSDAEPLQQSEYTRLVQWLRGEDMRPADLLEPGNVAPAAAGAELSEARLTSLLRRGVQLGFAVETWTRGNIWVICRSDPDYPARYKSHLKDNAPPMLFGAGERSLLQGGGLAIVGSRNVDAQAEDFTRETAEWCARHGRPVVSGGARGVDQIAMKAALDAGGCVVGILAESLLRNSVSRDARKAIADSRLLLISPYHPEARFTIGTAMGRNKLIYAMADYGLVVSADHKKGGTWAGATEELKRQPSRPIFVRTTGSTPVGNRKLLELGAVPFPSFISDDDLEVLLQRTLEHHSNQPAEDLFSYAEEGDGAVAQLREAPDELQMEEKARPKQLKTSVPATVYDAVLPVILATLKKPVSVDELAERLDVASGQLQAWLKRAVAERKIEKLNKPVRYQRID